MRMLSVAAVIVASTIACRPDAGTPDRPGVQERDSAGIRIVENARPPDGSRLGWRIGPEPTASIGVLEGDDPYMLFAVRDATVLSDGRIVVVGGNELRVFDPAGIYLETWGGRGEGPGEFTDLYQADPWLGDSIVAGDFRHETVTVFDSDGNAGRVIRLEDSPIVSLRAVFELGLYSVMRDGSIILAREPSHPDTVDVAIFDAEGGSRRSLGSHPGWVTYFLERANTLFNVFFSRTLTMAPWGDLVVISPTDRSEITAFTREGAPARIVRLGHEPREPEQAHVDAYIEGQVSRVPSEMVEYRAQYRGELRDIPVAERFPAFTSVMTDALDHLWVEEFTAPGEERPGVLWTVLDPEGRVLGFVETPDGLEIYEIGADYIVGKTEDEEFGVESVRVWPLERSGG